jgi:hypothetical protein
VVSGSARASQLLSDRQMLRMIQTLLKNATM